MLYVCIIAVQEDSMGNQQTEALLHTSLPSIRTKLKQRPGKRKSALTPPSIAQLPWMQEWIATGVLDALESRQSPHIFCIQNRGICVTAAWQYLTHPAAMFLIVILRLHEVLGRPCTLILGATSLHPI